jgi:hypothetical protein
LISLLELNFAKGINHFEQILPKDSSIRAKFCQRYMYQALKQNFAKDSKH